MHFWRGSCATAPVRVRVKEGTVKNQVIAYYIGIFGRPDFTLERITQTQPVLPALLLLAVTHLAVVLGIPFGLPALGIGPPYNEAISGFEIALLSGIVTIGLVHLVAGLAHGVVRLTGGNGNYLGLLAAFALTRLSWHCCPANSTPTRVGDATSRVQRLRQAYLELPFIQSLC